MCFKRLQLINVGSFFLFQRWTNMIGKRWIENEKRQESERSVNIKSIYYQDIWQAVDEIGQIYPFIGFIK